MTLIEEIHAVENDVKSLFAKLKANPVVHEIENDALAIESSAIAFIKAQGLQDLYKLATSLLLGIATGTSWATLTTTLVSQAKDAGMQITKGAESIVLSQAQADLIAVGKLVAPSTGEVVQNAVAVPATAVNKGIDAQIDAESTKSEHPAQ